jgi:hypothetical protein
MELAAWLGMGMVLLMIGAAIVVIACPGGRRMFCAGFLAATWTYVVFNLAYSQSSAFLLTPLWEQIRKDVTEQVTTPDQFDDPSSGPIIIPPYPAAWQPPLEALMHVGDRLIALSLGLIGGWLSLVLSQQIKPRSGDTFQPPA